MALEWSKGRVVRWVRAGVALSVLSLFGAACVPPTSFEGESKFPGGAPGCLHKCREQRMEMASFVYVGEFSTACACRPIQASQGAAANDDSSAAIVAASAGVELQRRNHQLQTPPPMMMH
jgi:hypothetical protein